MQQELKIYNTLSREKEVFTPISAPYVGMYVCGPTVYSDVHLGNCRTFTAFDIMYRYLLHSGYKVRYVRNITDVGHLVGDADEGEDKIGKKAKLENLEPMEIAQRYTTDFHRVMEKLNNLPPSIEPSATGHILEQIELVQTLLEKGLAYEINGSVYFDVRKYNEGNDYGKLSGRVLDELMAGAGTRELDGQEEKRDSIDFALWKKASPEHIMRWDSPWGVGFPGWHLECSVMSNKYLGKTFDIHGGGMDLKFPHHECEIAQGTAANGQDPVKYWMHTNMLTINGQRMGKSVGNAVLPNELFTGSHDLLDQAYSPMTLRFFMLQTHYRSTMDLSNEALKAASKGYLKLMNGLRTAQKLTYVEEEGVEINEKAAKQVESIVNGIYRGMNDDLNTAVAIAGLFNLLKKINSVHLGQLKPAELGKELFDKMINTLQVFTTEVLGLKEEKPSGFEKMLGLVLKEYKVAKEAKDYGKVDEIRANCKELGIAIKDMKDKIDWAYDEQI
ncbi:cysteine--tRNA ligase [Flammeovirgaceae bacterium SG7u.111]|nr:cysteine--tRNA ligase [Flammeovirgaceae bacterium SG7u.132]WPO34773.1 cysteine--tRNA ligase [Flammeovirgaceae bacterium SG7u.111]